MAHVVILRECPSFVIAPNAIYGTHEQIEMSIARMKYPFNAARNGYTIPSGSQFQLLWYRVKKEAIPEFLRDLRVTNLNPEKMPFKYWFGLLLPEKLRIKFGMQPWFWKDLGKAKIIMMCLFRLIPFLKGADAMPGKGVNFSKNWNYNFFLGYIPDGDRGFGEEL